MNPAWSPGDRCRVGQRLGVVWNLHFVQVDVPLVHSLESRNAPGLTPFAGVGENLAEVFFDEDVLPQVVSLSSLETVPNEGGET